MAVVFRNKLIPELGIRSMRDTDVIAVAHIERASYPFPWSEGIFRDCLCAGYYCCVAEIDQLPVGYGILTLGAGEAHVLNVCVLSEYRCRGLGRRLLSVLFNEARVTGATDLYLEVRPSNFSALRLYEAMGLSQVGLRRGYYQVAGGREDAIVMRLGLKDL